MKIALIIIGGVVPLVAVFQIAVAVSTNRAERHRYRSIKQDGGVEIRSYWRIGEKVGSAWSAGKKVKG